MHKHKACHPAHQPPTSLSGSCGRNAGTQERALGRRGDDDAPLGRRGDDDAPLARDAGEPTGVFTWSDFNLRGAYSGTLNDRGFLFELPVEEVGAGEVVHGVNPPLMRIAAANVMEVQAGERERWAYPTQRTRRRPRDLTGTRAERINAEIERKRIKRDRKRWLSRWFRKDR